MSELTEMLEEVRVFNKEREWEQFNKPKDVALSIVLEASELLEHFQWRDEKEFSSFYEKNRNDVEDEVADILIYLLIFSDRLGIDVAKAVKEKMKKNRVKYPIEKAKGRYEKYDQL